MNSQASFIGVDVGGTKISAVLMDQSSDAILHEQAQPTQAHEGPTHVIDRIADQVRTLCREAGRDPVMLCGVGVGVPAVIDYAQGQTLLMPNLAGNWIGLPVEAMLKERLGCPVWLVNDARAFALAEATFGAGKGAASVACFTIGTGVGGGLVIDGRLHMGLKGSAGEFGHQTIEPNGPLCGCGNHGCLESLVSGPTIASAGIKAVLQGVNSEIGRLVDQDITRITPATIKDAAERGDRIAIEILERVGEYLGIGISNVITIFAPERVVVGGGVMALGDWILNPARKVIQARCITVNPDDVAIVSPTLGPYAGAIGAAVWSRQRSGL